MYCRRVFIIWAALTLVATGAGFDKDEAGDLKQALALQKVMQKAIRDAEPAIACILVSRSDEYQRRLGHRPNPDQPGKLGDFRFENRLGPSEDGWKKVRQRLDLADPGIVPESFGSGVVIDEQGLVLTNYHVVREATKVYVRLPNDSGTRGKGSYADILAADSRADLAVLRLLQPPLGLKTIALGDAAKCRRGQFVLSIANPFAAGFRDGQPSASWGILSNIRRRAPGNPHEQERVKPLQAYGMLLQTDARLNLGCSGGALINLQGEMIGLTTALAAIHGGETPGGFAVPIDAGMRRIIDVLKRGEEVDYGFLGVIFPEGPPRNGLGIELGNVVYGSPAQLQGRLQSRDRILEVNDKPLRDHDDLFLALGTELAGSRIKLLVQRARGERDSVHVTLVKFLVPGKRIASSLGKRPYFRGLRVDYASLAVQPFPYRIPPGVMVSDVRSDSPAAAVNLKAGEIITHVQGQPVNTPAEFYQEVGRRNGPIELTLHGAGHPKVTLGTGQ